LQVVLDEQLARLKKCEQCSDFLNKVHILFRFLNCGSDSIQKRRAGKEEFNHGFYGCRGYKKKEDWPQENAKEHAEVDRQMATEK
jgi:hypothetical protein